MVRILVGSNLWITWSQIALDQPGPRRRREPPSNATSTPGSISLDALDLLIEERSDPGAKLILGKPEHLPSGVGPNREDWIARRFAMKEPTRRTPADRPGRTRRIEATDRLYRRCGVTVSTGSKPSDWRSWYRRQPDQLDAGRRRLRVALSIVEAHVTTYPERRARRSCSSASLRSTGVGALWS